MENGGGIIFVKDIGLTVYTQDILFYRNYEAVE